MCAISQPKFWPKKPVMKVSGRKTVARMVSCSMVVVLPDADLVLLDRDHRHVGLQHVPSRSRWAATSSLTSSRWSWTSRR